MSVYPYEVPLMYIDANNDDGIGGADIIYRKEIVKKISGKGCQDVTLGNFTDCIQKQLKALLENTTLNCKGKNNIWFHCARVLQCARCYQIK